MRNKRFAEADHVVPNLGRRLRDLRKRSGFTQSEIAEHLKIDQSALSHLEKRGDMLVSTLKQYLEAVGAALRIEALFPRQIEDANISAKDVVQLALPIVGGPAEDRRDIVFSIRPEYSEKIVSGHKTVELRRRFPRVPAGTIALIYTSSPTQAITGVVEISEVLKAKPSSIWKDFSAEACITRQDFDNYFSGLDAGYAIKLRHARPLKRSLDLQELRSRFNFEPPQSYLYATPQLREALQNECSELFN